jgi:hypothetical protein
VIVIAVAVSVLLHVASAQGAGMAPTAEPPPETVPASVQAGASAGLIWAVPLICVAALLQFICILKARDLAAELKEDSSADATRSRMPYLRFYADAPVFLGFLGSVTGAILLQVLGVGQMIYFAYASTATGLIAFLFIQYRYLIPTEAAGVSDGENA